MSSIWPQPGYYLCRPREGWRGCSFAMHILGTTPFRYQFYNIYDHQPPVLMPGCQVDDLAYFPMEQFYITPISKTQFDTMYDLLTTSV